MIDQKYQCLASYAVFRNIYNSGNNDIYTIIAKFVEGIIESQSLHSFGVYKIKQELKKEYDFHIPEYVIRTALGRLDNLVKKDGDYYVNNSIENPIKVQYLEENIKNENILNSLYKYIEEEKECVLTEKERIVINNSFSSFLLDDSNGSNYSDLISAFLLKNQINNEFMSQIKKIKEGVVLYAGLNYNDDLSNKSWNDELHIYLEQEILYHIAGYNGDLFKELFEDLFKLIQDMNIKNKNRKVIKLFYFNEVKDEIEKFFDTAENIIKNGTLVLFESYAMQSIVNGCSEPSDIIDKKSRFYALLKSKGIQLSNLDNIYDEKNHKYNLESNEIIKKYNLEKKKYIKYLSFINILRKGKDFNDLKKCKYILLTETNKTLTIAQEQKKENHSIPLAINMYRLTNRLWFDLNKGFGATNFPKSFDTLTKARLILSKLVTDSLVQQFEKVSEDYINKKIDEDTLMGAIVEFKKSIRRPDEINIEDVDIVLQDINENKLEKFEEKYKYFQSIARNQETISATREKEVEQERESKELAISNLKNERRERLKDLIESKNQLLESKNKAEISIKKRCSRLNKSIALISILYLMVMGVFIFKYPDIISYVVSVGSAFIGWLYFFIKEKTFNPKKIYDNINSKIKKNEYDRMHVDFDKINAIEIKIERLKKQLE